jgi:DNA segregation ATPase FtsK/SpoIIIE, S-DNA-T family
MRCLTPTGNRRLNELVGFLALTAGVLVTLSLISYTPHDASFNVASPVPEARAAYNWIGPAGAYGADLLFQILGYAAFLLPVGLGIAGVRWLQSRAIGAPLVKMSGAILMLLSVASLLALLNVPAMRGTMPPGGIVGTLLSRGLRAGFNPVGAYLVAMASLFVSLFMSTEFSFSSANAWLAGPLGHVNFFPGMAERWNGWRDTRDQERQRKRLQEVRVGRRQPATEQPAVAPGQISLEHEPENDAEPAREEAPKKKREPIFFRQEPAAAAAAPAAIRAASDPRIAKTRSNFRLPSPDLLRQPTRAEKMDEDELKERARAIEKKCQEFEVSGHVTQINPGPVVTTFEFKPEAGIKYSRITGLAEDLCLALQAESILIERIPGKSTVGIEVPNRVRETIALREVIESPDFVNSTSKLNLAMGKDLIGRLRVSNLAEMPHLLIAGSTGTGKSVFLNALILSMLYKATPDELKLVLVDPKRLELGLYEDIPHLLAPVVTDPKVASNVLRNATREMERRLKLLAQRGVRNIDQYNRTFQKQESLSLFDDVEEGEHKPLPYIVIVIDELADLMMVDTTNVEESITRLAQMARAVGIHLILATQRPSVDVITGLIKANFPARISFRVASKVDSRTILDSNGSESLLGKGDMLYLPAGSSRLHRIHGPFVTEDEITGVCTFWREQAKAQYNEDLLKPPREASATEEGEPGEEEVDDELYQDAVRVVCEAGRASTSTLQRRLRIGYGRAARLIDLMEKDGIVGPPDGTKPREVLKKKDWMREFDQSVH